VIASNKKAHIHFEKLAGPTALLDQSWQQIPCLSDCGEAIQQSIESPGRMIRVQSAGAEIRVLSQAAPDEMGTITWVYL